MPILSETPRKVLSTPRLTPHTCCRPTKAIPTILGGESGAHAYVDNRVPTELEFCARRIEIRTKVAMLRIRLRREGARKQPSYRVVVADSRAARGWCLRGADRPRTAQNRPSDGCTGRGEGPEVDPPGSPTLGGRRTNTEAAWNTRESQRAMKELVEYIVKQIASHPDEVKITDKFVPVDLRR